MKLVVTLMLFTAMSPCFAKGMADVTAMLKRQDVALLGSSSMAPRIAQELEKNELNKIHAKTEELSWLEPIRVEGKSVSLNFAF